MIVNKNVLSLELILNSDHFQCVCVSVCGCLLFLTSCLLTKMMFLVEIFMSTWLSCGWNRCVSKKTPSISRLLLILFPLVQLVVDSFYFNDGLMKG